VWWYQVDRALNLITKNIIVISDVDVQVTGSIAARCILSLGAQYRSPVWSGPYFNSFVFVAKTNERSSGD
jgi:hypothetical protein